jgi:Cu-Zn family superoxide dismutase
VNDARRRDSRAIQWCTMPASKNTNDAARVLVIPLVIVSAALAAASSGPSARAILKDAAGKEVGAATFTPVKGGVRVAVHVAGLTPGKHGIHIHAVGRCDPPDFKSAGPHFNPFGREHGLDNPKGAHAGDMPNLSVGEDGKASAVFTARGATLDGGPGSLFKPGGTAVVIHADRDDERSDPSGNSGARIACGVVEKR